MKTIIATILLSILLISCGDEVTDKESFVQKFSEQYCEQVFECGDGMGYSDVDECQKAMAVKPMFNDDLCYEFDLESAKEYLLCFEKLTCSEAGDHDKCTQKYAYKYCKDKDGKKEASYKIANAVCKKGIKCDDDHTSKELEKCSYNFARRLYKTIRKYTDPNTGEEVNCTLEQDYIDKIITCNEKLECSTECELVYDENMCKN